MTRFINFSSFRPETFLSLLPGWELSINGYAVIMVLWNILLAALAVWLAFRLAASLGSRRPLTIITHGVAWLLLLPNTAYIMTDIRHIIGYCPPEEFARVCQSNAWMTIFFFAYASLGWYSFTQALRPVLDALAKRWKVNHFTLAIPFVILSGLGIMLGLVNRWNSWEIITDPAAIIRTAWLGFSDLTYLTNWLIMSVLLYLLYAAGRFVFRPLDPQRFSAR